MDNRGFRKLRIPIIYFQITEDVVLFLVVVFFVFVFLVGGGGVWNFEGVF